MEKILLTDLDGTILNGGKLSEKNKQSLIETASQGVEIILSTGKGLPRVDKSLKEGISNQMILENGAKLLRNGEIQEKKLEKNQYIQTINILNKLKSKIEFLFFYDSKDNNRAHFYVNKKFGISEDYINKFNGILSTGVVHDLDDLNNDIIASKHNIGLLNVKVIGHSIDELGIGDTQTSLKMVFNEGMLNIGVADKGDFAEDIISEVSEEIKQIVVAGNDKNDLPLMNKVIELTRETNIKVGLIIVGVMIDRSMLKNNNPNVTVMHIDEPDYTYIGIEHYFSNN